MNTKKIMIITAVAGVVIGGGAFLYYRNRKSSAPLAPVAPVVAKDFTVPSTDISVPKPQYQYTAPTPPPVNAVLAKYPEGSVLRSTSYDKGTVYYIDSEGKRRGFTSSDAFTKKYGLSFSNVKTISDSEMAAIPRGDNLSGLKGVSGFYL